MSGSDELGQWDAVETAQRIARGEVSASEVLEAAIERATQWQPRIHAIATPAFAEARTYRPPAGAAFEGVPTFIKDLDEVQGLPTGFGSRALEAQVAKDTAACVREFLAAGVVSLGKSTTAEFGFTATTEPQDEEPTRNPRNLEHSAGGSSGGAAALVAAGVVPLAHASDGGGSIRIPAAWCGLVGLKPSRGRLRRLASSKRMPIDIATYGVVTRSVRDTAAFYAAAESEGAGSSLPPIGRVEGPGSRPLRIGVFTDSPFGLPVHREVRATVDRAASRLSDQGHAILDIAPPFSGAFLEDFFVHWALMAASIELYLRVLRHGRPARLEPWTKGLAREFWAGLHRAPGALWRLRRFEREYAGAFANLDVMLCPTTATPAPPLGHIAPSLPYAIKRERLRELLPFTPPHNVAGAPALSMPFGTAESGLPLAVQLSAPVGEERRLLELAFALETPG